GLRNETQHLRGFVGFHFVQPNLRKSLTEEYYNISTFQNHTRIKQHQNHIMTTKSPVPLG
ncbi:MAG: hypothetical protein RLZZ86_2067, partial [Cyanobacteriota bacterium]